MENTGYNYQQKKTKENDFSLQQETVIDFKCFKHFCFSHSKNRTHSFVAFCQGDNYIVRVSYYRFKKNIVNFIYARLFDRWQPK